MAAEVIGVLPVAVAALPFATAAALALVAFWRIGTLINAASTTVVFLLSCALPWRTADHLAQLTAFIAMTTSWYGWRDIPVALNARLLGRRRIQLYHVAFQVLLGAMLLALLAEEPIATWFALVIAVAGAAAIVGVARSGKSTASWLLLLCGSGLMLALLGTLLLDIAPAPATILFILGYGGVAGLVPLHGWLADAATEAPVQGAILVSVLMVNTPLLPFMRLQTAVAPALLLTLGIVSLIVGGTLLLSPLERRRAIAFGGLAQLGLIECAISFGTGVAPRLIAMLALIRAAALQCQGDHPTQFAATLALALLPLFSLYLLAEPAAALSAWLLVPLGTGTLLTSYGLLRQISDATSERPHNLLLLPVWLELALAVGLVIA
jgi:formate hydrogenlyase subunit 3/multisubunit Na+/H+ antiporter MnhD subunit